MDGTHRSQERSAEAGDAHARRRRAQEHDARSLERAARHRRPQRAARGRNGPVPRPRRSSDRRGQQGRQRGGAGEGPPRARPHDARWSDSHLVAGQREHDHQGRGRRTSVHAPRNAGRRLPAPAQPCRRLALAGARRRRLARARRQDALLDLRRRDARAPELRAVRVGRGHRSHGDDRRPSPLEDGGEGQRPSGVGDDAHSAESHPGAAAPLRGHRRRGQGGGTEAAAADHAERLERVLPGRRA